MSKMAADNEIAKTLGLDQTRRSWGRAWRWTVLVLAALTLAIAVWFLLFRAEEGATPRFVTAAVERGDLSVTVTATGTLEPTNEIEVSSELSGIVRKVRVDHNDEVEEGQVLAELDTDKLEAEVAHARATLAVAKARVKESEATLAESNQDFERYRQLVERKVASEQRFDEAKAILARAEAALESAKADVAVAKAELELKETDLSKACICSPIKGIVLSRDVEPGQTVASTLQAPTLFRVAEDLSQMELQVDVDEADVSLVAAGQTATFTVDAYPNRVFPATITKVRFAPETTEGVVTYKTYLAVDNGELLLRPGMTATAEIAVRTLKDVLLVPNEALRFVPPAPEAEEESRGLLGSILPRPPFRTPERSEEVGQSRVWVLKDGDPHAVPVVAGLSDGQKTEVLEGALKAGQDVLLDLREAR